MNVDAVREIVSEEGLDEPVLYGVGRIDSNSVILDRRGDQWRAWISDERGGGMGRTLQTFDNEPDALEDVLTKLRQVSSLRTNLGAWRE
jgi:hypothetical protein